MNTRDIDHLAVVSDDMPLAMDFYTRVLGDMGNDSLFAVFEYPKGLPRQQRDHVGAIRVIGPVPLGGRFWSAYFLDPFGTRLELATDRSGTPRGVVESVLQSEDEARAELETLFCDPAEVQKWLRHMPLKAQAAPV